MLEIKNYEAVTMLDLPEGERELIGGLAGALAESFGALENVDTDGVEPLVSVLSLHTILREDVSEKFLTREELMSNAPEQYDGYFQVPGTLE